MTKKVLITGGTGFIGSHLVRRNIEAGNEVTVLTLAGDAGIPEIQRLNCRIVEGDICDYGLVETLCEGKDIIFHCAAVVTDWAPMALFRKVNIEGMENMCRAAAKARVGRFVEMSTNDVFGLREDCVIDETFPLCKWHEPYADTKIDAEKIAWRYHKEQGLPVTMVYPCWVYGPGDKTFVPLTADAIVKGEMVFWRKDVIVWPTYIDNLMDLLMLIAERPEAVGNGYLVHDGECTTFQEFCTQIAESLGVKPAKLHIPYGAAYTAAILMELIWKVTRMKTRPLLTTYTVKNLGSRLRFSIGKAEQDLGWRPAVSYQEGFAATMSWLKTLDLDKLKEK
ncbi:MAG: NAD-dependent epimerase/dehydratase family protein [Smithellaceae bacterium]|nr:NAD-dependent epimerase/dehydratase family protein [Smithellaceae bacterium]